MNLALRQHIEKITSLSDAEFEGYGYLLCKDNVLIGR